MIFNYIANKYTWSPYGYNVNPKCISVDKEGLRTYANMNDPECESIPHVSGVTQRERWDQLHQKLIQRGGITAQDPFPEQNVRGLDMDYVFITDGDILSDQSAYYMYWTDSQTGVRWQMDSRGIVTTAR